MGKVKKENDTFLKKKAEEQQNSATTMISVERQGTIFPMKLKLHGESFEETYNKSKFQKTSIKLNWDKSTDKHDFW